MKDILFVVRDRARFGFMSNFEMRSFKDPAGDVWLSSEHRFQAYKAAHLDNFFRIKNAATPNEAKRLGREVEIVPNWLEVRDTVMRETNFYKYTQNLDLFGYLLDTGDALLIEDAPWDAYWGWGKNKKGENRMGKILMELRKVFQEMCPHA